MVGMHKHLHVFVLAQVEVDIAIHGFRLAMLQFLHHHVQRLLVVLYQLWLRWVGYTTDAWRQHVVHRCLVVVLLDVYSTHLQHTTLGPITQALLVDTPLAAHQVERTKAQHDRFLESRQEHTHKAHAGKVADRAHLALIFSQRYTELIPVNAGGIAIAQFYTTGTHVGDETIGRSRTIAIGIEYLGRDVHLVLVVALILVQRVVLVDILHIRPALVAGIVRFGLIFGLGRVALRIIDALIAIQNAGALGIEIRSTEVVIVVAGRVVAPRLHNTVVGYYRTNAIQPLVVGAILLLLIISQSVVARILFLARTCGGGKGVGLGGLYGYLSPLGGGKVLTSIHGHAALVEFLSVAQYILAHLAQVKVQVAGIIGCRTILACIDKRIEQPELDVFDVGLLKVVGINLSHHTSPLGLGVQQLSVAIQRERQVVRSALLWIVGQIKYRQRRCCTVISTLVAIRIQFLYIHLAHIVVRQLV